MRGRLAGRSAVVLGGTHGMGHATAAALIAEGASVLVTGRNERNIEQARADFGEQAVVRSDIADVDEVASLAALIETRSGSVDAVFLFAGVAEFAPVEAVSVASFDRQFSVNTRGAFFALQRIAPLVRDGGSITVTTVTPATASPGMAVYMGSKAAVLAFARVLAAELVPRNVRVNALAPGFVDTPTLGIAGMSDEERRAFAAVGDAATPMKRHGSMEEIARAALFLGFDATFSTGIELAVDGGLSTIDAA